jgi:hypothetical protein
VGGIGSQVASLIRIIRQIEELLTAIKGVEDVLDFAIGAGVVVVFL